MIKCDTGTVSIVGDEATVLSEFVCLIQGMQKSGIPKEHIAWAIDKGFKEEKELDKEIENTAQWVKSQRSTLMSLLELLESIEGDKDEKHSDYL